MVISYGIIRFWDSLYLFFWTFIFPCVILALYMLTYTEPYFMNNKKEDYVLYGTS